jgi:hypothetical protein
MQRNRRKGSRSWLWGVFAVSLVAGAITARPASAVLEPALHDGGPGTRFLECRAESWSNYNSCLMKAGAESEKKACDLAWDIDNIACDIELLSSIVGGLFSFLK